MLQLKDVCITMWEKEFFSNTLTLKVSLYTGNLKKNYYRLNNAYIL